MSAYCTIYAGTDNFNGNYLIGPMVPREYVDIISSEIVMEKYSQPGVRCTLLPGAYLNEGTALGACSMLSEEAEAWSVYVGFQRKG